MADPPVHLPPPTPPAHASTAAFACDAEAPLPPGWNRTDPLPGTANLCVAYDPRRHTVARFIDPPSPGLVARMGQAGFTPLYVTGVEGFFVLDRAKQRQRAPAPATAAASRGLSR